MPYRLNGIGGFGFSINWEKVPGDKEIAQRVIVLLEDRRVLFGPIQNEFSKHCIQSAIEIRSHLTHELSEAKPGRTLATSLQAMRAALRAFVDAGGPDGKHFHNYWNDSTPWRFNL